VPVIPAILEAEVGILQSETERQKHKTLSGKQNKSKRTGGMAQVVDTRLASEWLYPVLPKEKS
jgi:hypothetical protein